MKKADVWDGLAGAVTPPAGTPGRKIYKVGIADPPGPKGRRLSGETEGSSVTPPLRPNRKPNGQWNGTPKGWSKGRKGSVKGWKYKSTPTNPWGLTKREAEILTWLVELGSRREVMKAINIGEHAYDAQLITGRKKLKAKTSMGAVLKWAHWVWSDEDGQALRAEIMGVEDEM